jgi:hypothetical protein
MSYKLIIAVLTIGLLLTFSSAAISSDDVPREATDLIVKHNPNAPLAQSLTPVPEDQPVFEKPWWQLKALAAPQMLLPPQYFCEFIDYSGGAATYYWQTPPGAGDELGMRFDSHEGYYCTLLTAYIGVYFTATVGTPDVKVEVYADDGFGLPGLSLGSVVVSSASWPATGMAYVAVDLTSLGPIVIEDGDNFHVGVEVANWEDGDTLAILSDACGGDSQRAWDRYLGAYETILSWSGCDPNFLIGVDICCGLIPYTECYTQDYTCGVAYYFQDPHPDYGDFQFATRFSVGGPETLMEIGVATYAAGSAGTGDLEVYIWGDDGTGFPDVTNEIFKTTIPNASIVWFPGYNVIDMTPYNLIMTDDFHVGMNTDVSVDPTTVYAGLMDDGTCGAMRSSAYYGAASAWLSMIDLFGEDNNWLMYAYLCKDEFSNCRWISDWCSLSYFWRLPDDWGDVGNYQLFAPSGLGCRLELFDFFLYDNGDPDIYTYNSEVQIWTADAVSGLPDVKQAAVTLTPGDYVATGWNRVDWTATGYHPFLFDDVIWIGLESLAPDEPHGIRTTSDDNTCGKRAACEMWYDPGPVFSYFMDDWTIGGDPADINFNFDAYVCCVPLPERVCLRGENWPTMAKDFGRSNASLVSLGADVQGNLKKAWTYVATEVSNLNSPVIYNDTVVNRFLDHVVAVDMNDGSEIWKNDDPTGYVIGGACYSTPTVYNFADYGTDITLVFVAGGDAKAFSALDLADGSVYWTNNFVVHSSHFMTWGTSLIAEIAGDPVVIYNDDNGKIYCADALTGALVTDWDPNPIDLDGQIYKGLSTDGTNLYVGTNSNVANGDIYCVDIATGATVWTFGNQQLCVVDPGNCGDEAFTGGIAYDVFESQPTLFTASSYDQYVSYPPYKSGGVMYSISAVDGSLNWASACNAQDYNGPAVDAGHVIQTGWNGWLTAGEYRGPVAFNKNNGKERWSWTTTQPDGPTGQWMMDGILSCETQKFDWYIVGSNDDILHFHNSDDGAEMFHRQFAGNIEFAHHYAASMTDGHLLLCYWNKMFCLTEQDPRPRLDIPSYQIFTPVEFGALDPTYVHFPNALGNMGGAPLTIFSVTIGDDANGNIPPTMALSMADVDRVEYMEDMASKFSKGAGMFRTLLSDDLARVTDINNYETTSKNNAAYTYPAWIKQVWMPTPNTVIPPQGVYNDSANYIDIVLEIDGTQVPRGLTPVYATIDSDDPDYYLDSAYMDVPKASAYAKPQILLGIVGGCLYDIVELVFGESQQNFIEVFNSTKIREDGVSSLEFDGDDASYFQGAMLFAQDQPGSNPPGKNPFFTPRVAMHSGNWHSNPNNWESILPDPNCYNQTCAPDHRADVLLGEISTDEGENYHFVYGEVVSIAFVDSCADMCDYDTLGNCTSWDWLYMINQGVLPPLSDTNTMGFHGCGTIIGAYDEPLLNNFIVYKFDFGGRYGPVNNVYLGAMHDIDIGTDNHQNVAGYDEDLSIAWAYNCIEFDNAWGMVKIPFGDNYEPMINAKTISSGQGPWNDSDIWLDSVQYWMSTLTGLSHQAGVDPVACNSDPDDRDYFCTIAELDMPQLPDRLTVGVAFFGDPVMTDADQASSFAELAHTANKWCGFERGDVNNDYVIDMVDIAFLIDYVFYSGDGPYPFKHAGDVDNDGDVDVDDINIVIDYYVYFTDNIQEGWVF